MTQQRAIVLGGGGFIGTNLCRRLVTAGYGVRAFGRSRIVPDALAGVDWREGDFADAAAVQAVLEPGATVFHLIQSTPPQAMAQQAAGTPNITPTIALLDAARAAGVARIVFVSSGGTVYGKADKIPTPETAPLAPVTPYAAANMAVEQSLARYRDSDGLDFRVLRLTNPYGPYQIANKNQGVIAAWIARAFRGERIEIWGDGSVIRDFIYIDDVTDALLLAAEDRSREDTFNIGSAHGRSLREVIAAVEEALGEPLLIDWKEGRPTDVPVSVVAIGRARDVLGWTPKIDFATGLRRTVAWWRERQGN